MKPLIASMVTTLLAISAIFGGVAHFFGRTVASLTAPRFPITTEAVVGSPREYSLATTSMVSRNAPISSSTRARTNTSLPASSPCLALQEKLLDDPRTHDQRDNVIAKNHFNSQLHECIVKIDGENINGSYHELIDASGVLIAYCMQANKRNAVTYCARVSDNQPMTWSRFDSLQAQYMSQ